MIPELVSPMKNFKKYVSGKTENTVKLGGGLTLYLLSSLFRLLDSLDLNARTILEPSMITPVVLQVIKLGCSF